MGNTYVVLAWTETLGGYEDVEVYRGESIWAAVRAMLKARKASGCIKLEWRPRE